MATETEKEARDRDTYPEWGQQLTLEQYLEREAALRAHPFSAGMRTWLLVDGSRVLASCETYDNRSQVGTAEGTVWSIASVFTEAQHRGRGYATQLMERVAAAAPTQACVLYSDVGERIYARAGYRTVPEQTHWELAPERGETAAEPCEPPLPRLGPAPAHTLQLLPSLAQLDWAVERERLYARFLRRPAPRFHAGRCGEAFGCWAAYYKSNELIVLWLHPGAPKDTVAVLGLASAEAHRCGLDRVRLWGLPQIASPPAVSVRKRKEEVAMYRPGNGLRIDAWAHVQRALWV